MGIEELCEGLLEALERFDEILNEQGQRAQRLGQHQEWPRAIVPFLLASGGQLQNQRSLWRLKGLGAVEISLARVAKIKVRRYGSGYQVDRSERRDNSTGDIYRPLRMLQQPDGPPGQPQARVVLLIGFDKTATPLGGEIRRINDGMKPEQNGILFRTRCWMDRANRGFGVRLAVWARSDFSEG